MPADGVPARPHGPGTPSATSTSLAWPARPGATGRKPRGDTPDAGRRRPRSRTARGSSVTVGGRVGLGRMRPLAAVSPSRRRIEGTMPLLSLRGVCLAFGGPRLLDQADLQIEPGERVCLVGRNGEGKSTLLRLIQGELGPDEGTVERQQGLRV